MNGVTMMDENDMDIKSPIRRLGSTRKLNLFNNIRQQLNEQLKFLDVRMESQISLIQELQDFFRRRGEVELDYSKSLDKLAKSLQLRHKEQRQKREQWPMFSSYSCWQQLVNQTKSLSKDHAALSEIYSVHLVARLQSVWDDVQRIYRKCREIGFETHVEILRILQELHTNMKTYHTYQTEAKEAEKKLRAAENQRMKLQQSVPKEKLERSKKYKLIEKEVLKRKNKYTDARLKALKAKNEYQLCLEASNTTIHKYFVEDLSDLIDCMDLGFHSVVSRALLMHVSADQGRCRAVLHNTDTLSHIINSMDSRADKQKFLEQHSAAFMIPKRLEFQGQEEDIEPELQKALHQEMESRLVQLEQRVNNLRMESEEIWKTLETAEVNLLEILNTKDYDCSTAFGEGAPGFAKPENASVKLRSDKNEIEEFYITKIREYILATSRIARLDSKAEFLRSALTKDSAVKTDTLTKSNVPKRKRIGRMNKSGRPKLFGGSLEEYLEATGEEIPLILRSCIRVINLFGLHHQGIFRVSGSQVEISNFKEGFERGDDPLSDMTDASDINSVAGVLKLYLRAHCSPSTVKPSPTNPDVVIMWPEVQIAKEENRRELVLSGAAVRKRFEESDGNLDETIYQLSALNLLNINDTPLEVISPEIGNLEHLQSLLLFRNKITSIPLEVCKLATLKVLDLSGNRIESLPSELGQLKALTTINLSGNKLKQVDLGQLEWLAMCNLSSNQLEEFPVLPCGKDAQHLYELNLEKNQIKEIPASLVNQGSLKTLNVAENNIELVPQFLVKCVKLKEINLKDNPLKDKRLKKLVEQCRSKQVLDYVEKNGYVAPKSAAKDGEKNSVSESESTTPEEVDTRQKITILKASDDAKKVSFTPEAKSLRPYAIHCIVRDFTISNMKKFLQLQNDLHDNECGKREFATIATHDLAKIKGNIRYRADLSEQIQITPLGGKAKVTAAKYYDELKQHAEMIRKEKKRSTYSGIYKFINLLEGKVFVCFEDDEKIISLPPLTNCEETKITPETKHMLLEVTSSIGFEVCHKVMSALIKKMLLMNVLVTRAHPEGGKKKSKTKGAAPIVTYDKAVEMFVEQVRLYDAEGAFHSVYPGKGDLVFPEEEKIDIEFK